MIIVRQSTARIVTIGPVLDADGVAVTGAAVSAFKIAKNGGAPAALNGSATLTHRNTGHYSLSLTTGDTDTVGQAEIVIDSTTNACPVKELSVIEEAVYDALFAASAPGYATVAALATVDGIVDDILLDTAEIGAAGAGLTALASQTSVNDLPTNAELATALGDLPTAAENASQVRTELATELGRIDAAVSTRATPAQVATELGTYDGPTKAELDAAVAALATASNLATVAGYLDTEIAAIKAVTDLLIAAQSEPSSAPAANATPLAKLAFLAALARNKSTLATDGSFALRNDGDTADILTRTDSDDGTTYTKGKVA